MRASIVRWLIVIGAIAALPVATGSAQEAVLSGTVTDSTGGVVPGVTITAVHEASGNTFVAVTDERGEYRLPVRVGMYRVTAELLGFGTVRRDAVELLVGQAVVVNLQIAPSALQETVTVSAEAPLVDTTKSSLGTNIDPRQMENLPLNGRNWMDLTMLAQGSRQNSVAETPTTVSGSNVNFHINLDGQQITNLVALTFGQPHFSRDAIAEFEFVANRFDARQGRSSGVQVNAITKSGTNTPSGSLSGYFRSDKFNAADPVVHRVLPYSDQQVSGTFGGPIQKDRAHFFGNYEYEREPQTYSYTTPYPRFNTTLTGTRIERKGIARLDFQFSSGTRLTVRGTRYDNELPYDPRYTGGADKTPASAIGTNRRSEQVFATLTQILNNRAVNEVKAGHDAFHWNQYPHVKNTNSLPGMISGFGAPQILLRGITLGQSHQITPQDIGEDVYSLRDDLTVSFSKAGRHDVKIGGEYLYNFTFEDVCYECMGILDARGGNPPANLESLFPDLTDVSTWNLAPLSPITRTYTRGIAMTASPYSRPSGNSGFTEYAPRHVYAGWIQDDWTVNPRLTLNLGLRYDLELGTFVNWVEFPPFLTGNRPNDKNNVAPRLGFALTVTNKTVIRGGVGRYFGDVTGQPAIFTLRQVQQIHPQLLNDNRPDFASNPFNGPAPTYDQAQRLLCANNPVAGCFRPGLSTNFAASDLAVPYSNQASIGVQRQVSDTTSVAADYVYTASRGTLINQNINLAYDPATGANYAFTDISKRPYPNWGGVLTVNRPLGQSNYHALQASLTKRLSNRWQASATYLLSGQWDLDPLPLNPGCRYPTTLPSPGVFRCDTPIQLAPDVSENAFYLNNDQRSRVTFNGIWDIGHGFQFSGLYVYGDNGYLTPTSGVDARLNGSAGGRRRANGTLIARNSFDLPSMHRVDMRVQRGFKMGNRAKVDGIVELFNVFNHANYETFVVNESNPNYGQPTASTNVAFAPRMLQLGFRATF